MLGFGWFWRVMADLEGGGATVKLWTRLMNLDTGATMRNLAAVAKGVPWYWSTECWA